MSLPATDAFTGTDGTALTTHSASWTEMFPGSGGCSLSGNKVTGAFGAAAFWNADTFNNDQYSQTVVDSSSRCGPLVRGRQAGDATHDYYVALDDLVVSGATILQACVNGSRTTIVSLASVPAGHTCRLEVQGTTLRVYDNGVQVGTDQTDSNIADGSAGVCCAVSGTQDTWEGGNLAASLTAAQQIGIFDQQLSGCVIGRVDG